MKVLVTGAAGFIGRALVRSLRSMSDTVVVISVRPSRDCMENPDRGFFMRDAGPDADWSAPLAGVEVVIHAAARVHVMNDQAVDPLAEYRRVNVLGTLSLARQAAAAGVRRFIFLSSIKVNGESSAPGRPFTAEDVPAPQDAYGISKLEAEEGLRQIALATGMEIVTIRPALVYGAGVEANFRSLLRAVRRGVPLPLGAVNNLRSFIGLDNLVSLIVVCIDHPAAANQVFLAADGEDVATPELVRRIARGLGRPARLFPVPLWLLHTGARALGKEAAILRLCGHLQLDVSKTRALLGWSAPFSLDTGLAAAIEGLDD